MNLAGKYLMDLVSGTLSPSGENVVIHCGHQLATRFIEIKKHTGNLQLPIDEAAADIAWDAIAPIFELSSDRHFEKLRDRIVAGVSDCKEADESDLLICYRKIIHQAVSDEIFKYFRDQDPALARIIRNLKDTVNQRDDMEIRSYGFRKFVCYISADVDSSQIGIETTHPNGTQTKKLDVDNIQNDIDSDILRIKLWDRVRGSAVPGTQLLLDLVREILSETDGKNRISLTGLALAYRELYVMKQMTDDSETNILPLLTSDELAIFVNKSISCLQTNYYSKYVDRGKISDNEWHMFMECFRQIFLNNYQESDTEGMTYFDVLKKSIPNLTPNQYRDRYKAQFEYLISLMRTEFINHLKKEFDFGRSA